MKRKCTGEDCLHCTLPPERCHGCSKSRKSAYNAREKKAARTDKTAVKLVTSGLARKFGGN